MDRLLKLYVKIQTAITSMAKEKLADDCGEFTGMLAKILIVIIVAGLVIGFIKMQWGDGTGPWASKLNEKITGLFNL